MRGAYGLRLSVILPLFWEVGLSSRAAREWAVVAVVVVDAGLAASRRRRRRRRGWEDQEGGAASRSGGRSGLWPEDGLALWLRVA